MPDISAAYAGATWDNPKGIQGLFESGSTGNVIPEDASSSAPQSAIKPGERDVNRDEGAT